jgi:putative CocE/NonD family hydrolase
MCDSQVKDGVAGAVERLAKLTGQKGGEVTPPTPVKAVDGPDGPALLQAAMAEHQANVDMAKLLGRAAFSDDRLPGLDWQATTPAVARQAIEATGVPMLIRAGWLDGAFAAGALRRFATFANQQEVEIGPWGHGGRTYADTLRADGTLRPDGTLAGDRLVPQGQDRRLVEFFTRYVEHADRPDGQRRLIFGTLGTDQWQAVSSWPPEGACTQSWYLTSSGRLASEAGPAAHLRHVIDPTASTGPVNRWLAVDLGRGTAYPDRRSADEVLLTFTSDPLPADLQITGFPVITLRLATSGSDGAIYAYLEDVAPDGTVTYLTEGCLRFLHRATNGPADPTRLGVPRTFARADRLPVEPGQDLDLAVELLPIAALLRAGHQLRVALGGHDAACFDRYGPPAETFTVHLGNHSTLDLPILTATAEEFPRR